MPTDAADRIGDGDPAKRRSVSINDDIPLGILLNQSVVGIYIVQDETIVYANAAYAAIHGYEPHEIVGEHISVISSPEGVKEIIDNIRRRISGEAMTIHYVAKGLHRSGHTVYTETHGSRFMLRGRPAISGIIVDVTERVLKEQALRRSHERFRRLARHLVDIREQQRREFSRELHDVVGGMLTALKMRLTHLARWETNIERIYDIDEIVSVAEQSIAAIRELSRRARSPTLDSLGFAPALEEALVDFKRTTGIDFTFQQGDDLPKLSANQSTHAFRIFQEALTNIARHSGAHLVEVSIGIVEGWWTLRVLDDGVGIVEDALGDATDSHGILGMHERASSIGSTLVLKRLQPTGTLVQLAIPLSAK